MRHLLFLSFVASLVFSCKPSEILEPTYSIIDGIKVETRNDISTNVNSYIEISSQRILVSDTLILYKGKPLLSKPTILPDLKNIKNEDDPDLKGKPFRMVVTGGDLLAGTRNGGYYNEALETSFPNLMARQMGIEFYQPYFESADYNGFNRVIETKENHTGGPVQKYKFASNNLGVESIDAKGSVKLKTFKGARVDNFAGGKNYHGYDAGEETSHIIDPLFSRLRNSKENLSYGQTILKEKFDFIIEGSGLSYDLNGGLIGASSIFPNGFEGYSGIKPSPSGYANGYSDRINYLLEIKKRKNIRGLLITIPDSYNLPRYHQISVDQVAKEFAKYDRSYLFRDYEVGKIIPTSRIDSLLGKNVNMNIKPWISQGKILTSSGSETISKYFMSDNFIKRSKETFSLAKSLNFAVLDLNSIYEKILNDTYVSPDGIVVNTKNFFASNGISTTDFGNAVIANEAIIAINKYYKTEIPLIPTKEYLKQ